jgi:hypothetical protein
MMSTYHLAVVVLKSSSATLVSVRITHSCLQLDLHVLRHSDLLTFATDIPTRCSGYGTAFVWVSICFMQHRRI